MKIKNRTINLTIKTLTKIKKTMPQMFRTIQKEKINQTSIMLKAWEENQCIKNTNKK